MTIVQPINFQGSFIKADKFKGNTAQFVNDIINKKVDNVSNKELLLKLPFDVEICRSNKSHKAIHPKISCYINYKQFWGKQTYYIEHGADYAIDSIRKWLINFNEFVEKNKDRKQLSKSEEMDNIFNFIRTYGVIKGYKPLQRH